MHTITGLADGDDIVETGPFTLTRGGYIDKDDNLVIDIMTSPGSTSRLRLVLSKDTAWALRNQLNNFITAEPYL